MASGKLSPRQKMINMMYLVLTALLALNVSREILKSFHMMEQSFLNASVNLDGKNDATMQAFKKNMETQPAKTKPFYERAKKTVQIANDFNKYIEDLKKTLTEMNGGREEKEEGDVVGELKMANAMEKHANYFINEKHGVEVQKMINDTRDNLLAQLKSGKDIKLDKSMYQEAEAATQLKANDPKNTKLGEEKKTWVSAYLEHNPLAGVMALLTKIQNDAKSLESDVLTKLASGINAADFKFDQLQAKVIASSSYVMTGTPYEADVLLVASNSKSDNVYELEGGKKLEVEGGVGKFSAVHSDVGVKHFNGNILVTGPDGSVKKYPFEAEYQTFKPAATISADKMNVLYIGLQNPISVSVPGFPASSVSATISGGGGWKLSKKGGGKYMASGGRGARKVIVSAVVKTEKGNKTMGRQEYRIRPVPLPRAKLGTLDGTRPASVGLLRAQRTVYASLGEGFAFEGVKFKVTKFTLVVSTKKGVKMRNVNGSNFSSVAGLLGGVRRGDQVIITSIKASGPGGVKSIPGIVIPVQ
jgi:gliding motility-associated protein GldM